MKAPLMAALAVAMPLAGGDWASDWASRYPRPTLEAIRAAAPDLVEPPPSAADVGASQAAPAAGGRVPCGLRRKCRSRGEILFSAIITSFRNPVGAPEMLVSRLRAAHARIQILVSDDSHEQSAAWIRALNGSKSNVDYYVASPDTHEISNYNHLVKLALGEYIVVLQSDYCLLPIATNATGEWLRDAEQLFARFPRLGLLGGHSGRFHGERTHNVRYGAAPFYKPIPTRPSRNHAGRGRFSSALLMALGAESDDGAADADALARLARHEDGVARARGRMPSAARRLREAEAGRHEKTGPRGGPSAGPTCPFMFVEYVDIGPLVVRRDAFVSVGGFSSMFSCLGDPGIGLDEELSMQFWLRGYQVGLFYAPHYNGIGGRLSFQDTRRGRMEADNKRIIQAIKERHLANITRLVDEATATEGLALIPPAQRSNAHANVYGSGKGGSCPPDLPAGGPAAE